MPTDRPQPPRPGVIEQDVRSALAEDLGRGDVSAQLIPASRRSVAELISREAAIFCGSAWAEETFRQLDPAVSLDWTVADGDPIAPGDRLCRLHGPSRALLSGERCALNFIQILSAVATATRSYVDAVAHTRARILDTRKTIPGLRRAQKYAVACGGGYNHRFGLYDAFLIKENHIAAAGSIEAAVTAARHFGAELLIEVEVETLAQLEQTIAAGAGRVLLDNFNLEQLRRAVELAGGRVELEASGGIELSAVAAVAETGVDFISVGALTKNVRAVDLTMRLR